MNAHHASLESLLNRQNFVYFESIKREVKIKPYMSVGVMKDYKLKLRDLRVSHTLGW
jgi:hypothetical protein